jgi:hypothetical protein
MGRLLDHAAIEPVKVGGARPSDLQKAHRTMLLAIVPAGFQPPLDLLIREGLVAPACGTIASVRLRFGASTPPHGLSTVLALMRSACAPPLRAARR